METRLFVLACSGRNNAWSPDGWQTREWFDGAAQRQARRVTYLHGLRNGRLMYFKTGEACACSWWSWPVARRSWARRGWSWEASHTLGLMTALAARLSAGKTGVSVWRSHLISFSPVLSSVHTSTQHKRS